MQIKKQLNEHAQRYIKRIESADPADWRKTDLILDTNVMGEILSLKDLVVLLREYSPTDVLRQPKLRYRQFRAQRSIVLGWWLSKSNLHCGVLGAENVDILTGHLAPEEDELSFSITRAIVHIIHPIAMSGWRRGALVEVDHQKTGADADREILKAAQDGPIPVVTWEGFQEDGTYSADASKLRNLCLVSNIPVFTPAEYLLAHGVDFAAEAKNFLGACEEASWRAHWDRLTGWRVVDNLIAMYRFILFDEVSDDYAHLLEDYRALKFEAGHRTRSRSTPNSPASVL